MPPDPRWPEIAQKRARFAYMYSKVLLFTFICENICRKVKIISRYKFYLAFENAAILDYVSEKVFMTRYRALTFV